MTSIRAIVLFATLVVTDGAAWTGPSEIKQALEPALKVEGFTNYGGVAWWKGTIRNLNANFVRLRIEQIANPENEKFSLTLRDRSEAVVKTYLSSDLRDDFIITPRVPGDTVTIAIESAERPRAVRLVVKEYWHSQPNGSEPRALSIPQAGIPWQDASPQTASAAADRLGSVALVVMTSSGDACTGFLVSDRHVLTNRHCLELSDSYNKNSTRCDDIQFEFDTNGPPAEVVQVRCGAVIDAPRDLDMAVLEIRSSDLSKIGNRKPFVFVTRPSTLPHPVLVLHHPGGVTKLKVSLNCEVSTASRPLLNHDCATIGGSSGGPIFDRATGEVVALHAFGFEEGLSKAKYDKLVAEGTPLYNKAIEGSVVSERLKSDKVVP